MRIFQFFNSFLNRCLFISRKFISELFQLFFGLEYQTVGLIQFINLLFGLFIGFGIYLGRFLRFNSWDVLFKPRQLYHDIGLWVANPLANPNALAFPVLFATFLFVTYLMLYALTHLQEAQPVAALEAKGGGGISR